MKLGEVARNPLGIIGLFISLIYGFANWMLGSTANTLVSCERIIIIWFIVLFPVMILIAFCYLVVNHHGKLYAPKDYNKDESFLQTLSGFDSFVRLTTEALEPNQEFPQSAPQTSSSSHEGGVQSAQRSGVQSSANSVGSPKEAVTEISGEQELEVLSDSATEAPIFPDVVVNPDSGNDLDLIERAKKQKQLSRMKELFELTQYFIKTDERFAGAEVKTNVKMGATGVVYDAAAYTDSGLQCLEVKYLRSAVTFKNILHKFIYEARIVKSAVSPADLQLKLVVVYDWDLKLESDLRAIVKSVRPMLQDFIKVDLVARPSITL